MSIVRQELELTIYNSDDNEVQALLQTLSGLEVRARRPRVVDPVTVITVAGAAVSLVNKLLELRDRLRTEAKPLKAQVRNEQGDAVALADAKAEDLERLLQ